MRISDWSSDVCSSDLWVRPSLLWTMAPFLARRKRICGLMSPRTLNTVRASIRMSKGGSVQWKDCSNLILFSLNKAATAPSGSEEHQYQLKSPMPISYAVSCFEQKTQHNKQSVS